MSYTRLRQIIVRGIHVYLQTVYDVDPVGLEKTAEYSER
jgi:hypothetical protein